MSQSEHPLLIELPGSAPFSCSWHQTEHISSNSAIADAQSHDHYEIYIHIFGDVSLEADGRVYLLSPGDTIILPPYTLHRLVNLHSQVAQHYSLRLPETFDLGFLACLHQPPALLYLSPSIQEAGKLISLCKGIDKITASPDFSPAHRLSAFSSLICLIEEMQAASHTLSPTSLSAELQSAVDFIECAYSGHISVQDISNAADVSPAKLTRLFKDELDTTPVAYLLHYRLRKAQKLLHASTSLRDICEQCGFFDYSRFIERFRRVYGITPHKLQSLFSTKSPPSPSPGAHN